MMEITEFLEKIKPATLLLVHWQGRKVPVKNESCPFCSDGWNADSPYLVTDENILIHKKCDPNHSV